MGTPVTSPYPEYGNDCNRCTPDPWPAGKTPLKLWAYFEGIINCGVSHHPAPNGYTFRLDQSTVNPCMYEHIGTIWWIEFLPDRIAPDESRLRMEDDHGYGFFSGHAAACPLFPILYLCDFPNCVALLGGARGQCLLTDNSHVIALVQQFGLDAGIHLMTEMFVTPASDCVHKFTNLYQKTNVKFKISQ